MRSLLLTLLVIAGLVYSSTGYILKSATYYATGDARPSYFDDNDGNNARAIYLFKYLPESKTLDYRVLSTLINLGTVTLNGPAFCNRFNQDSDDCRRNDGPVVFTLGKGLTPTDSEEQTGHQMISGTLTLDSVQEAMFFDNEFYILINSAVPDPENENTYIDKPVMRGGVYIYDNTVLDRLSSFMIFGPNGGEFDPDSTSQSKNEGFGYLYLDPDANANQVSLYLFNTITQPGKYFLTCNSISSKQLFSSDNTGGQNPSALYALTLNFQDNEKALLSELLLEGRCYVFITSAEYPNGDLFSWIKPLSQYTALSLGANEEPPVTSSYIAYHTFDFDYARKVLRIMTFTNLTTGADGAVNNYQLINGNDDTVLCNIGDGDPFPYQSSSCQINGTYIPALENGTLYFRILADTGNIRGPIIAPGAAGASALAIGLGVGLGVGIPVLAAAGVGTYFLVKKKGGSMSTSGKI